MRLAIAAGILAQTLPATTGSSERVQMMQARMGGVAGETSNAANMGEFRVRDKKDRGKKDRDFFAQFKNVAKAKTALSNQPMETTECDPNSEDTDVGILSCGLGRYCMESSGSELGGLCVLESVDRELQYDANATFPGICNATDPEYDYFDCDCSYFDPVTYTGSISCASGLVCFDDLGEICYAATYYIASDGANYTTLGCYYFVTPYPQLVCTAYGSDYADVGGCAILFNDDICNSCQVSYDGCTQFDCSNTCAAGLVGDVCSDYLFPILDPNVTFPECLGTQNTTYFDTPMITETPSMVPVSTTMVPESMVPGSMVPESMVPGSMVPGSMVPGETPMPVADTPAPVAPVPEPTAAPVEPEPTAMPSVEATATPDSAALALFTGKTAVSLFGLSMGVLAYFAA
eukprot:CAMPEP_0117085048 /NCGR_PEP_ID=MMETSP0472-20121206/59824_1 /TAXON_ID=693140 ORGANISM="Tiarina fusus, Strain LIS" /NCGR_SAMPLE_ID=MMETSP0472 /ASSEMBLY_ACC=CAM_ASM_000603 /LENGTH=403 /DNA_ID=CAMNT_0004814219 /DNA_START=84 /DNA_END=1295 /DNA_ORIENTATION=-